MDLIGGEACCKGEVFVMFKHPKHSIMYIHSFSEYGKLLEAAAVSQVPSKAESGAHQHVPSALCLVASVFMCASDIISCYTIQPCEVPTQNLHVMISSHV